MMLLTVAEVRANKPEPSSGGMEGSFFTDQSRVDRRREMILQKRGMHHGR